MGSSPIRVVFVFRIISVSVYVDASHRHPALTLGCPSKHVCMDERARRATCFSGNTHYQERAGVLAQLGEHLPYKQRVIGSSPIGPMIADVAQLAEQLICNQQVNGSSPFIGLVIVTLLNMGGFPSGQRGQTVNLLQIASVVRIHLRPFDHLII